MPTTRSDVCRECPWRRHATAGQLGDNEPAAFAQLATGPDSVACHLMHQQTGIPPDEWRRLEAAAPRCRGAAIASGTCEPDPAMMDGPQEFIDYHQQPGSLRTWEKKAERRRIKPCAESAT
jgi:hypothetical protein